MNVIISAQEKVIKELLESLATMAALCRLKYGNADKLVYTKILNAESLASKYSEYLQKANNKKRGEGGYESHGGSNREA